MTEDVSPPRASLRLTPLTHALILVFSLATALAISPYSYGVGDNRVTVPFVKAFANPALYPGDPAIGQARYYYTFLWHGVAALHRGLHIPLPELFFGVYLITLHATFLALYVLAFTLFRSHAAAVLSLLLLAFPRLTLAGIPTIDQMLTTRMVAVPFLLFGISCFLTGRTVLAFVLLGLADLAHPLTAHSVVAMLAVASFAGWRRERLRGLALGMVAFLVVASPVIVWRLLHAPVTHPFSVDPVWNAGLRLRSAYHMYPFTWGVAALVHALVTTALFVVTTRAGRRSEALTLMQWLGWSTVALTVAGVLISEVHTIGLAFLTQPQRAFLFLEFFVMISLARYLTTAPERPRLVTDVVVVMLAGVWIGYGSDSVWRPAIQYVVVAAAVAVHRYGGFDPARVGRFAAATAALVCFAAGASWLADGRPTFSVDTADLPIYLDVQHWARTKTDVGDGFIVPPEQTGEFRVEGERSVYIDWEEGGLMNGNPEYAPYWMRRMNRLGYWDPHILPGVLCNLDEGRLIEVAEEMRRPGRRVFVVWPCLVKPLQFPVRYRNRAYTVYEIPAPSLAPS